MTVPSFLGMKNEFLIYFNFILILLQSIFFWQAFIGTFEWPKILKYIVKKLINSTSLFQVFFLGLRPVILSFNPHIAVYML